VNPRVQKGSESTKDSAIVAKYTLDCVTESEGKFRLRVMPVIILGFTEVWLNSEDKTRLCGTES
jgi:hypothetical protein